MPDLRAAVTARLDGRPDAWLARQLGVTDGALYQVLRGAWPNGPLAQRLRTYAETGVLLGQPPHLAPRTPPSEAPDA